MRFSRIIFLPSNEYNEWKVLQRRKTGRNSDVFDYSQDSWNHSISYSSVTSGETWKSASVHWETSATTSKRQGLLIDKIIWLQARNQNHVLFTRENLMALFRFYDQVGRGYITMQQYHEGIYLFFMESYGYYRSNKI